MNGISCYSGNSRRRNIKFYTKHILFTILIFTTLAAPAQAQGDDNTDFQTWMDFRTIYDINEKFTYDGNYGLRVF